MMKSILAVVGIAAVLNGCTSGSGDDTTANPTNGTNTTTTPTNSTNTTTTPTNSTTTTTTNSTA